MVLLDLGTGRGHNSSLAFQFRLVTEFQVLTIKARSDEMLLNKAFTIPCKLEICSFFTRGILTDKTDSCQLQKVQTIRNVLKDSTRR